MVRVQRVCTRTLIHDMTQPIGIFDSGIGGLSVLRALRGELPNEHFIYIADSGHAPYGERNDAHVIERSQKIAAYLVKQNIKALVVACNTATAAAIDLLRAMYPGLPIVGVEPALKPAVAASQTKHIAVMATRSTLESARFAALLKAQAVHARFSLLACDGLAQAIEQSAERQNATELRAACARIMGATSLFDAEIAFDNPVDTIVLGCTHYGFAAQHIAELAGAHVTLLDTGEAVARQTHRLLGNSCPIEAPSQAASQAPSQAPSEATGPGSAAEFITTGNPAILRAAAITWLGLQSTVRTLGI